MSFILICLYVVCTIIRPQEWVPMFLEKPLISWLAMATVFSLLLERMMNKDSMLLKVPQNLFMVGLLFSVILSHASNGYLGGVTESFPLFIIPFLLFFIVLNSLDEKWKLWSILWILIILVNLLVWQGIDQAKTGIGWAGQEIYVDFEHKITRINWIGIFNDPNDLALLFVIAAGILLPLVFSKINFLMRLISVASVGFLGYGVFLTNSRGGYLALMATFFFFFVRWTNKIFWGSVLGCMAVAASLAIGPSRLGLMSADEDSANSRLDLWYEGLRMFFHRPIFGVGYGMFTDEMPLTAHNSYVLAVSELGFVGLFFWVGLIYVSYMGLDVAYRHSPRYKNLAIGIQSGLIGFCVAAFFLSRTYVILPYLLFALAGAVMYQSAQEGNIYFELKTKDYQNIFWICCALIFIVYAFYKVGLK